MREYDETFEHHVADRRAHIGISEVAAFVRPLRPGSRVRDLGCGHGVPITKLLTDSGFEVFAIDSSERMIASLLTTLPGLTAECETLQNSTFFNTIFDAVEAWGVLFHLPETDQEAVVAKASRHLESGGRFLFTSGIERITSEWTNDGFRFPYVSLGHDGYAAALGKNGMTLLDRFDDQWENTYDISERATRFWITTFRCRRHAPEAPNG